MMKNISDVTILFVDDEINLLNSLRRLLRKEQYQTFFADNGADALKILSEKPIDIVVSDLRMPDMDGLALLAEIKVEYPETIRLILSASRDVEQTIEAINTGEVYRFITKPIDPELFKLTLLEIIDYHLLVIGRQEMMTEIEKRLLQVSPPGKLARARVAATMKPPGHLGGDFIEYFIYDDLHMDILVGDVADQGVQPALAGASIKHQFAKSLAEYDCEVTPRMWCPNNLSYDITKALLIVSDVHNQCIENLIELELSATLVFARFDLASSQMALVDCGHLPVIHLHARTKEYTFLSGGNQALGLVKEQQYQTITAKLNPGDVLLFYTDSITQAVSASGGTYGVDRLARLVQTFHNLPPETLLQKIQADVNDFSGAGHSKNDFTCVAVYIEAPVDL